MSLSDRDQTDLEFLLTRPEFMRFLFRHSIQNGGILSNAPNGSAERDLARFEGRRDLALEMLEEVEQAQPVAHPQGLPILTSIQIMREAAQQDTTEKKPNASRPDRYAAELDDDEQQ